MTQILNKFKSVTIERRPSGLPGCMPILAIMAKTEDGADLQIEFTDPEWVADDVVDIVAPLLDSGAICWEQAAPLTTDQVLLTEIWHCLPHERISSIKALRTLTGCSLKAGQEAINALNRALLNGKARGSDGVADPPTLKDLIDRQLASKGGMSVDEIEEVVDEVEDTSGWEDEGGSLEIGASALPKSEASVTERERDRLRNLGAI